MWFTYLQKSSSKQREYRRNFLCTQPACLTKHYANYCFYNYLNGGLGLLIGPSESVGPSSFGDIGDRGVAAWSRYSRRRTSEPHERRNATASACDMFDIGVSFT